MGRNLDNPLLFLYSGYPKLARNEPSPHDFIDDSCGF